MDAAYEPPQLINSIVCPFQSSSQNPSQSPSQAGNRAIPFGLKRPEIRVPFPAPASPTESDHIPLPKWAQDESISLRSRTSRASSAVSTGTATSFSTLQEETRSARSVDIILGERAFHISHDGSQVSQQEFLPPYTPPTRQGTTIQTHEGSSPSTPTALIDLELTSPSPRLGTYIPSAHSTSWINLAVPHGDHPEALAPSSEGTLVGIERVAETTRAIRIQDPKKDNKDQTVGRSLSFDPGPDTLSVIPKRRTVSHSDVPLISQHSSRPSLPRKPLRRRNGKRLGLFTGFSRGRLSQSSTSLPDSDFSAMSESPNRVQFTHSAGPSLENWGSSNPPSPLFIGRGATGIFPSPMTLESSGNLPPALKVISSGAGPPKTGSSPTFVIPQSPALVEEGHIDTHPPPPMDTENDISIHYTRLIRTIDRDHRRALHQRDKELAEMRDRLNELDQVYRKELRARDFTIDDLRQRLAFLEEDVERRVERARHEVEDQWEARWKDRDRHLLDRMRRIELECQRSVKQAVTERDEEWAAEWAKKNEQLLQRLRAAEAGRSN